MPAAEAKPASPPAADPQRRHALRKGRKMRIFKMLWILPLGMLLSAPASAARFPNAVEKRIVLTGRAAALIAGLFGLNPPASHSIALRLGRGDAWAVYLLKQDTKEKLWNDNDGSPARFNVVELTSSPVPSLSISPYWLDLGSRLPEKKVGYYSFRSPFVPEVPDKEDPWTRLLRRLKTEPGWDDSAEMPFRRCFTSPDGTELCIEVFRAVQHADKKAVAGHIAAITTHMKDAPPAHAADPRNGSDEWPQ